MEQSISSTNIREISIQEIETYEKTIPFDPLRLEINITEMAKENKGEASRRMYETGRQT